MKDLFNLIHKYAHWLLFFFLTAFSLYLLVNNSEFQRSKYLSVFQEISGRVHSVSNSVESYLNLKTTNADLMQRIAALEENLQVYKNQLENITDQKQPDIIGIDQNIFHYIHARVINKELFGPNNFFLLDKGSKHGITEDMGVVSINGIVGIVARVTTNYSRVILVLNPRCNPSCIIKNTKFPGSLLWDGKDPRYIHLSNLPSHTSYTIGDTIVTSGYSDIFPEGILVGVGEEDFIQKNEDYNSLKVRLFNDFSTLSEVFILWNPLQEERRLIEKGISE